MRRGRLVSTLAVLAVLAVLAAGVASYVLPVASEPPAPPKGIAEAPASKGRTAAASGAAAASASSLFWYWDNGLSNASTSICAINAKPALTFYDDFYICNTHKCLGGFGANPYRWSIWLRHNGNVIWSTSGISTSSGWINWPITLSTPLQAGAYTVRTKMERRVAPWVWNTDYDQVSPTITFTAPATPPGQAAIPVIRIETVADSGSDLIYRLRGWQTNPNASHAGQWEIYDSNSAGTQFAQKFIGWKPPGQTITVNTPLNLGQWYMLKYGNYSACHSWNETRRLIYIKK